MAQRLAATKDGREHVIVCDLGLMDYREAWSLQRTIQERLIRAKRAEPPEPVPHVFLLVEHPPVYTLGKSGSEANLVYDADRLASEGIEFVRIDRGGDITYHGPGQLVGYPILDLDRFFTDIHRYLRVLEEAIIRSCGELGLIAARVEGRTGVWIGPDERGPERKVCAMGIRCSRWVTMHGFALNVSPDLNHFRGIIPCGIEDRSVTSLAKELGGAFGSPSVGASETGSDSPSEPVMESVKTLIAYHVIDQLGASATVLRGADAVQYLHEYAPIAG